MNRILIKCLIVAVLVLGGVVWLQHRHAAWLRAERERYQSNNTALLSEIKRMQVDSSTMALDAKTLQLTIDEYKRFRSKDAATIKRLGVKVKNLEAAARHELDVTGPINAAVRDTVIIRDTMPVSRQKVEMLTPHIELTGIIENERLKGSIRIPVILRQAISLEYKGCWFWKRVKAVHQTISSDNPYVEIKYSEYIQIHKKSKSLH